jgi:hypothetical protein
MSKLLSLSNDAPDQLEEAVGNLPAVLASFGLACAGLARIGLACAGLLGHGLHGHELRTL